MKSTKQSEVSHIVPWDNSLLSKSKQFWMNCKEKKNASSDQNTEGCGSLALSQRTQETGRGNHFPHSTGHMDAWQMKKNPQG